MVNLWNIVFLILIIILFILVIVLFVQNGNNNKQLNNDGTESFNILNPTTYFSEIKKDKDILIHCSANNQNVQMMLNNLTDIYNHIDFISLNNISKEVSLNMFTEANKSVTYVSYNNTTNDYILNSKDQLMQGFIEARVLNNFNGVSLKIGYPLTPLIVIKNNDDNSYAFIRKYNRYFDKKDFYYIQIKIDDTTSNDSNKYQALSNLISFIQKNYTGDYMFVGDFGVQGHEFVFQHYLTDKKYLICPFYQTLTGNTNKGLTAYDGLVVSKNLYNSINYKIEFCPGDNLEKYMIVAELVYAGFGTIKNVSSILFKKYIETIVKNLNNRKNYINDKGTYSPNNITENVNNVKEYNYNTNSTS